MIASCLRGDLTLSYFLGEFSFSTFLANSLTGERLLSFDMIAYPKDSTYSLTALGVCN